MLKPLLLLALLAIITLSSCDLMTKREAVALNNTFVLINTKMETSGQEFGDSLATFVKTREFARLKPIRLRFTHFVDSSYAEVQHMRDVGGSEELKACELDYLSFERNTIERFLKPFEDLPPQVDMNTVSDLFNTAQASAGEETAKMDKFRKLQAEYAKRNGFKLGE